MKKQLLTIGFIFTLLTTGLTGCGDDTSSDQTSKDIRTSGSLDSITQYPDTSSKENDEIVEKSEEDILKDFLREFYTAVIKADGTEDVDAAILEFNQSQDEFVIVDKHDAIKKEIEECLTKDVDKSEITIRTTQTRNSEGLCEKFTAEQEYLRDARAANQPGLTGEGVLLYEGIKEATGWEDDYFIFTNVHPTYNRAGGVNDDLISIWYIDMLKVEGHNKWIVYPYLNNK